MKIETLTRRIVGSKLIVNAGTYTFFKVFDSLIPFLLLPVITRVLNPHEYGTFVLFQSYVGVLLPLMTLSVDSSILLNYFKVRQEDFRSYFSSGYWLIIISSVLVSLIVLAFRDRLSSVTKFPADWVIAVLLICFFQFHTNLALHLYQIRQQAKKYGFFSISLTAMKNVFMLFFVIVIGMKWQGIVLGYLISYLTFFALSLYVFKKSNLLTTHVKRTYLVDNIKIGYPLSLHSIGSWLSSFATRIIVGGLLGTAAVGSFGVGASIAMVVGFVQDSFNKAFVPYLFERLNNGNQIIESNLVKLTYVYNLSLLLFSVCVGTLGYFFIDVIFGKGYAQGKEVVLLLSLAEAFNGMYKMHVNYIFYTKKTYLIFIITMTTGILNVVLGYSFVKLYGLAGAALSLCLINLVGYLMSWYIGNCVFPLKWCGHAAQYRIPLKGFPFDSSRR
jgi:O-antigen/teichoic acid export membrane protein